MADMMDGGKGMSPRKAMAGGADGGNFGVGKIVNKAGEHPDRNMGHEPMADSDRAIGDPIHHSRDMLPAQAAPKHGPTDKHSAYGR